MDFKTKDNFSVSFHYQQGFETTNNDPGLNISTLGNTENTPSDKIGETFYSSQMFEVYETFAELADAIGKKLKGNWSLDDDPEEVTLKFDFKKDELILWISNIDGKFCKCQFDKETSNQIIDLFKKIKEDWKKINNKPLNKIRNLFKK